MGVDLDLVERNLHNGDYLQEQLKPALLAFINRVKALEAALDLCLERMEMRSDIYPADVPFIRRMRDVIERGTVLP